MTATLRLTITTPASILVNGEAIASLRAEDESGSFGVLPGHANFLTVLTPSVLRWRSIENVSRFCAVEEGVLRVSDGSSINIACRNGVLGDSLAALETRIEAARTDQTDAARNARVEQTRMHAQALRQLLQYLRPSRGGT
jgi:F-type H+-transporting ATPase subunit epsilon